MTGSPSDTSPLVITSTSEAETARLGELIGAVVEPRTVIGLVGGLGAGKTRLVQGIAAGLGADRNGVNSPTFVLIQEYAGRLPIRHFDTYRLRTIDEFIDLGAEEYFAGDGVCLVEWSDRVAEVLPEDLLRIEINVTGPESRQFSIQARGRRAMRLRDQIAVGWPRS